LRRSIRKLIAVVAIAGAGVLAGVAIADIEGDRFTSAEWRVSLTAPRGWLLTEQTSYPNILLWMVRHDPPGKMLLSAEQVEDEVDAQAYATGTLALLETLGFEGRAPTVHSSTGAYYFDIDNGVTFLRQAYLVSDGIGYALTLAAGDATVRGQHSRAFDYALRSIRVRRGPTRTATDVDAGPAGEPAP
jgi:hypothetical protein